MLTRESGKACRLPVVCSVLGVSVCCGARAEAENEAKKLLWGCRHVKVAIL